MPDDGGYVVLSGAGTVHKFGSAARADTLGPLGMPLQPGQVDRARSIAIMPDGKGYAILLDNGTLSLCGSATSLAAIGGPLFLDDDARSIADHA